MKTRRAWRNSLKRRPVPRRRGRIATASAAAVAALRGRRARVAVGAVALVLALSVLWLFNGEEEPGLPDPRARQYSQFDACLLTGEKGVTAGTPAAPVWKGMQRASLDTRARVTYVPVTGEQSAANAELFLNSLVQRRCEMIVAVGAAQVEAVESGAGRHPKIRFAVVGEGEGAANVTVVKPGSGAGEGVAEAVRDAVDSAGS